jgi:SPP1 gp7 family putative phage head morphogenesis protein
VQEEMETSVGRRVDEIVAENARLISSIPEHLREQVDREIHQAEMAGARHEAIAKYLQKRIPQLTRSRAALIARTETGKSAMALTQARAEDLELPSYRWATSEDARVRDSHRLMDKVIVFWSDPPSPEALAGEKSRLGKYHAGNCPNCRCDAYPLIDVNDVDWPHKVYSGGRIHMMTLVRFKRLAGRMVA